MVGERAPRPGATDLEHWRLTVDGLVERRLELSWSDYLDLPKARRTADIHCVTGWSRRSMTMEGVPLATLLEWSGIRAEADFVRFEAASERRHDTSLPLDVALADTWLVHAMDGAPLTAEHGAPLRTVTPGRYFYKSLKWLAKIELMLEDRLGYWERESDYHNVGDPWAGDQRFVSGSITPEQVERFRSADSFARWRGPRKVLLGLDLRGWKPRSRDLRELQLKNCDLSEARLEGVDLRAANLSLSRLRGADLRAADLRGADLEGVDFSGADLRGADLRQTALSATRFFRVARKGETVAARVDGMRWEGATGLLEDQESFLEARTEST